MKSTLNHTSIPSTARWLGYAGLIPFYVSLVATLLMASGFTPMLLPINQTMTFEFFVASGLMPMLSYSFWIYAFVGYAAVILSFIGALHWSFALLKPELSSSVVVWSVMPALIGWLALVWVNVSLENAHMPIISLLALLLGFATQWWADWRIKSADWYPRWFWQLRCHLTLGAGCAIAGLAVVLSLLSAIR